MTDEVEVLGTGLLAGDIAEPGKEQVHQGAALLDVIGLNGRFDLLAELRADSNAALSAVLERVRLIKGIASSETNILLATYR